MRRTPVIITTAVGLTLLAGCGGHATPAATTSPPVASSVTPTASPTVQALVSPLTGEPVTALGPVVAVKIDDVGTYGQNGLDAADVVYCEEVEGGLTRLLAIFSTDLPTSAGPVRSARESDLELLGQYGRIALAFSGANSGVVAEVKAANVKDDSYDELPGAYAMDHQRPKPYQFLADVAQLAAQDAGDLAKDVGFRFGAAPGDPLASAAPSASATATSTASATGAATPPGTTFSVTYPGAVISGLWGGTTFAISRNHRALVTDDMPVTTTNVLLQYVTVRGSKYTDHNHNPTPYSETIGSGQAVLLRGGQEYEGSWSRDSLTDPTTWTSDAGGSLTLAPGRTWVILVPVGAAVTIG